MNPHQLLTVLVLAFLAACQAPSTPKTLPILGNREVVNGDTVYHTIPDFRFVNQDSIEVTPATFAGKYYVVDYFFTSCPTICPKVKQQELRVAERFKDEDRLQFLSVSIDTKYDTIPRLKWYADKLEIDPKQWHLVTGEKAHIYDIADDFFHTAIENEEAPGGYDHDGLLILVDPNKHIRSFANGLEPEEVNRFMDDIQLLLSENTQ